MTFNKNNDDIIDAEFVVDENIKSATNERINVDNNQFIHQYEFNSQQRANSANFSSQAFFGNMQNKKGFFLAKPNFFVLLLLSPIILVLLFAAFFIFLFVFILFVPKIIKLVKNRKNIFMNQNEVFKNIFNRK